MSLTLLVPMWLLTAAPGLHPWAWAVLVAAQLGLLPPLLVPRMQGRLQSGGHNRRTRDPVRSPAAAIGMFIGGPFIPVRSAPWSRYVLAGFAAWCVALVLVAPSRLSSVLAPFYLLASVSATWGWFMLPLDRFGGDPSGPSAELALLPGMGGAACERHALFRVAMLRPLLLVACGLAAGGIFVWSAGSSPSRLLRYAVGCAVLLLLFAVALMQVLLAERKKAAGVRRLMPWPAMLPLALAPGILIQALSVDAPRRIALFTLLLQGAVVSGVARCLMRALARRARPFTQTTS